MTVCNRLQVGWFRVFNGLIYYENLWSSINRVYDALSNLINGTFMNLGYDVTSVLMHVFLFVVVYVAGTSF